MEELDDVVVADNPSSTSLWKSLSGNDHPVVVLILVGITSNLLALTADSIIGIITGVALRVGVQQILAVHMLDGEGVKVTNFCGRKSINAGLVRASNPNVP